MSSFSGNLKVSHRVLDLDALSLKESREGKKGTSSKFVCNSDVIDDTKLVEEVLKQDPEALSKMTPTGIGWAEVAESLSRPREVVYRDWVNQILNRRHRAGINHLREHILYL